MSKLKARVGTTMSDEEARKAAAATRIQAHYRGHVVRKAMTLYRIGGMISEVLYSPAAYGVDLSSQNAPKPRARINANICVVKNKLWLFGGIVEIGDREVRAQVLNTTVWQSKGTQEKCVTFVCLVLVHAWS